MIEFALHDIDNKNGIKLLDLWKAIAKLHSFNQEIIPLTFPLFKKSLTILENEFTIIYWEMGRQRTKKYAINTLTIPKIREIAK